MDTSNKPDVKSQTGVEQVSVVGSYSSTYVHTLKHGFQTKKYLQNMAYKKLMLSLMCLQAKFLCRNERRIGGKKAV
jgi:hypothetical protein